MERFRTIRAKSLSPAFWFLLVAGAVALSGCGLLLDSDALVARAQEARDRGDFRAASLDLRTALRKDPENGPARLALGEVSLEFGDFATAMRELEAARDRGVGPERYLAPLARAYVSSGRGADALALLEGSPTLQTDATQLALQGHAHMLAGRTEAATASYRQSVALEPTNVESLLGLAAAAGGSGDLEEALSFTDTALRAAPEDARVFLARGRLHMVAGDPAKADEAFRRSAAIAVKKGRIEQHFEALAGRADAEFAQGRVAEALETTDQLQKKAPQNPVARHQRARALFASGKLDEARRLLEQNVSEYPGLTPSKLLLGAVNLASGNFGQADMYLSAVLTADPGNVGARQLLAESRLRQRKPADALEALLPAVDSPDASAQVLALAARASLAAGSRGPGLEYLKRSARAEPDAAVKNLRLAAAYLIAGDVELARETLDAVPANTAYVAQRLYVLVLTRLATGDAAGAIKLAVDEAARARSDANVQTLTGALLVDQRQFERARPYFEQAMNLEPGSADALFNLGRCEGALGQTQQARQRFARALELTPAHPGASLGMAAIELQGGRPDAAIAVLAAARAAHPEFLHARLLEIRLLIETDRVQRAEEAAREAVRIVPDNVTARYELARVLAVAGKLEEARRLAEAAYATNMRHAGVAELLGKLAVKRGDLKQAEEYAAAIATIAPDVNPKALLYVLAQAQHEAGDRVAAARAYERILARTPDDPIALNNLAWVRYEQGDPGALALARRAKEAAPDQPGIVDTYAWLLVRSGQVREGLELLEPIAGPEAPPEIRLHYAVALAKAGRTAEAKASIAGLAAPESGAAGARTRALLAELNVE